MSQRILFVDDELRRSSIESVASYMDYYLIDLRETGRFEVEVATNADDAIDLLQQHEFAAAIFDVMMPTSEIDGNRHYDSEGGISTGIALACQIHGEWPHLPILMLSNMPSSLRKEQNSLFSELVTSGVVKRVLHKLDTPPSDLVETLIGVLDGERDR